jgi:hypothetical protein
MGLCSYQTDVSFSDLKDRLVDFWILAAFEIFGDVTALASAKNPIV